AFYYYQKAAEMGDATGLNKMGNMYSQGIGCERDPATAFYYYKQAAEKGNMYAQFNLANFYWLGSVVEEDRELAIIWFRRSAAQGYTPAKKFLKEMVGEEM
ncbi:MAG: sel1 repeat family protein, partial [Bacteroidaceae bacterium]|nr:sel1 repeat family protein [Bacteroidaceae bacterium]